MGEVTEITGETKETKMIKHNGALMSSTLSNPSQFSIKDTTISEKN